MRSYLDNRQQFVQMNNIKSRNASIRCGVPQGSILGPLLFLIYINDIIHVSDLANVIMFADDTNLFFSGDKLDLLNTQINVELSKLVIWFKLNKLSLNIKKTHFILFRTKICSSIDTKDLNIEMDGITLQRVTTTKFLGVILNENLKWDKHIATVKQKISKSLGIMKKIRHLLSTSILTTLYFSLIHPYLSYCNIIWASRSCVLNKLFTLQKKALRIITHSHWNCHSLPLFKRLRILPVYNLNNLQVACFAFRQTHNLLPASFHSFFVQNNSLHSHNTRQSTNLHLLRHRLVMRKNSIRISGPLIWNKIPDSIRSLKSISLFQSKYTDYLLVGLS